MARLPKPGGDSGTWGSILNSFLSQAHRPDGNLKTDSVGRDQLQENAVVSSHIAPGAITKSTVGLANVNNTSDSDKPVSTATQAALDDKLASSQLGQPEGVAALDADGVLDEAQVPERLTQSGLDATYGAEALVDPTTELGSAADAAFARNRRGSRTIVLGDSLDIANIGWFEWLCVLSNQKVTRQCNAGVAGQRTDDMLARIDGDVIAYAPDICIFGGCTNDYKQGVAEAVVRANLIETAARLRAADIIPVVRTAPPTDVAAGVTYTTVALHRAVIQRHNAWLAQWASGEGIEGSGHLLGCGRPSDRRLPDGHHVGWNPPH